DLAITYLGGKLLEGALVVGTKAVKGAYKGVKKGVQAIRGTGAAKQAVTAVTTGVRRAGAVVGKTTANVNREFTHWSQWNRPADPAWQEYMRDLKTAYEATGRRILYPNQSASRAGRPVWGTFNPATEQITMYRGWDSSTAFEELLHWEDLP